MTESIWITVVGMVNIEIFKEEIVLLPKEIWSPVVSMKVGSALHSDVCSD